LSSLIAFSPLYYDLHARTTVAPNFAISLAEIKPKPVLAPVIKTTFSDGN